VAAIPGVRSASLTDVLPLDGNRTWAVGAEGTVYPMGHLPVAYVRVVSPGYLRALGAPLLAGRDFTAGDLPSSVPVVLVNETLARKMWPGRNAVGQRLAVDGWRSVVGVVGDVRHLALEQGADSEIYLPLRQNEYYTAVHLMIRTSLPPAGLASAVRAALVPIDSSLPAGEFRTLREIVDKAVSPRRFVVVLLAGFSAFALLLASLGIYAVISYAVKQRTRELGIRMALGATARELQGRVLRQTLGLAGVGLLLGLAASWFLARTLGSLLFGVTAADPVTYLGMAAVLISVATLAGYLPARRAAKIDPLTAIRAD
jgi:predicted permease